MKFRVDQRVNPHDITQSHRAWDTRRIAELMRSMLERGWVGRPLLVLKAERLYALTGNHRLAAAKAVQIDVPVLLVDGKKFRDDLIIEVLRRSGDTDAANLLRQEAALFTSAREPSNVSRIA